MIQQSRFLLEYVILTKKEYALWGSPLIVRLLALGLFLVAAFVAFGDVLIAYANSTPHNFLNSLGHNIRNIATNITDWFGIF
ncbi:MAG: hypothetical protein ABJN21_16820 [Paracoccaceae bacterium]